LQREGVATDFLGCTRVDESLWPFGVEARVRIGFPTVDIEGGTREAKDEGASIAAKFEVWQAYLA
jgi:hypothetical protein